MATVIDGAVDVDIAIEKTSPGSDTDGDTDSDATTEDHFISSKRSENRYRRRQRRDEAQYPALLDAMPPALLRRLCLFGVDFLEKNVGRLRAEVFQDFVFTEGPVMAPHSDKGQPQLKMRGSHAWIGSYGR